MKLSIEDLHGSDLEKALAVQTCSVTLNGIKQTHCICADEENGFIERYVVTSDGFVDYDRLTGEIKTEAVTGDVKIHIWGKVDPELIKIMGNSK